MIFYIFIFLITILVNYFFEKKSKYSNIVLWLTAFLLILIVGLRSNICADDTIFYYNYFMDPNVMLKFEFGYDLLNKLIYYLTGNFNCLLLVNAALSILPIFYVISKINENRYIFILLYQSLVLYFFNFAIMRQTIAMSFCLLAVYFLITLKNNRNKIIAYSLCFLFAIFVHRTALLFSPVILLYYFRISKKMFFSFILCSIIITVFRKPILVAVFSAFFPDKVSVYLNSFYFDFGIVPVSLFAFGVLLKLYFSKKGKNNVIDFLSLINVCFLYLSSVLCWFPATGRLVQYGYLNLMFLLGYLYNKDLYYDKRLKILFIVIMILFYFIMLLKNPYHIVPYIFFYK